MIAITTIDTLPDRCYECPCRDGESGYCQADKERRYSDYRPYWCPLKEIHDDLALEDDVHNSHTNEKPEDFTEIKYPCGRYQNDGCGLDFNPPKYKEDCYFYGETKDMGAIIRYCTQSEIEWGYCPCEKCDKYISNAEASKIIRKYIEKVK